MQRESVYSRRWCERLLFEKYVCFNHETYNWTSQEEEKPCKTVEKVGKGSGKFFNHNSTDYEIEMKATFRNSIESYFTFTIYLV